MCLPMLPFRVLGIHVTHRPVLPLSSLHVGGMVIQRLQSIPGSLPIRKAEALSEKKEISPGLSLDVGKTFFGPVTLDKPDSFSRLCSPFGLSPDRVDLVSRDAVLGSS